MNDPLLPAPSSRPPASGGSVLNLLPLALALLAIVGVIWLAWQSQARDEAVQTAIGQKVADLDAQLAQTAALTRRLQAQVMESQNRMEQFESKLADTQTQRIALEEMYRELSRAPDDWLLAEIEQTLNIAAQQLLLAGNVRAALTALQTADTRLARADKLQTAALRRALNADMERLRAQPLVDLTGMTLKLDSVVQQIDALPLASGAVAAAPAAPANIRKDDSGWASRFAKDAWSEFRELVRIRKLGAEESGLLSPSQSYFLKENLKLRLLAARMSLLARDDASYREDLKLARAWLAKYFDVQSKPAVAALTTLKTLQDSALGIAVPDINQSINAVRAARAAREKGVR